MQKLFLSTMKLQIIFLLLSSFIFQNAYSSNENEAALALEEKFITATEFELIHQYQSVPDDVKSWFWSIVPTRALANYGELYSETDMILKGVPRAQHQFTVLTKDVAASLIKLGGFIRRHILIIVDREHTDIACRYRVKWESQFPETLQYAIKNKRKIWRDFFDEMPVCKALKKRD